MRAEGIDRRFFWSWPLFERQEVRDHVAELFTRKPSRWGHRRLRTHFELAEIGLDERQEPFLFVDDLYGVGVFVQPAASECLAVARRNPIAGLLTGMIIGLVQDSLTHSFLGLYGISKTLVGFAASSLGVKIDVENPGSRLLMATGFYLVQKVVYFLVARGMAGMDLPLDLPHAFGAAIANGFLAIVLFAMLDKTKQRS